MANITALFAIGLVIGALAGTVVVSAPAVVTGGIVLQPSGGGSSSGTDGACVSSAVHFLQDHLGSSDVLGQFVRSMARRC